MNSKGFSLVELAVVIVIIGVLAAFGIPRFREAVERSKSGEAFNYLSSVRAAEERYQARMASYATVLSELDINTPAPKYFSLWETTADEQGWTLVLQRTGKSAGYGAYTVMYTELGYSTDSNIPAVINAMGTN